MFTFEEKQKSATKLVCGTCKLLVVQQDGSTSSEIVPEICRCSSSPSNVQLKSGNQQLDAQEKAECVGKSAGISEELGEKYEVLSLLGRGGMGCVYTVKDKSINKILAVKILNSNLVEDANSLKRFEQEAKSASTLTHPNLVAVYDFGVTRTGKPFILMDKVEGIDLAATISKEGYLDIPKALDIFIQCTEALAHSHGKGIIHRDVKPSNIILQRTANDTELAKIVDFGIAKILPSHETAVQNLTHTGDIFGSPAYMSPEQCQGDIQDQRSDIYSLGCVMYEALTGKQPFAADNPIKTILKHINDQPKSISTQRRDHAVSKDLEYVVLRCLQKEPDDRYQTCAELLRDLQMVQDGKSLRHRSTTNQERKQLDEFHRLRKTKNAQFLVVVAYLQAITWAFLLICCPPYILPLLRHPTASLVLLVMAAWEALGIFLLYAGRPRSPVLTSLQMLIVFTLFVLPFLLAPFLGPAVLTVMEALGPVR